MKDGNIIEQGRHEELLAKKASMRICMRVSLLFHKGDEYGK